MVPVADTSHHIQLDQPAAVIEQIQHLLERPDDTPGDDTGPPSAIERTEGEWPCTTPIEPSYQRPRSDGPDRARVDVTTDTTGRRPRHLPTHDSTPRTVGWGVIVGVANAAAPMALWWLDPSTIHAIAITLIAAVYIGFAVADGRATSSPSNVAWRGFS